MTRREPGWTGAQKATASMACKVAGLDDDRRRLILRQFDNAMFDRDGQPSPTPSFTSRRLTNSDFAAFMAIVEHWAGGTLTLPSHAYEANHWARAAADNVQRMRHLAARLATGMLDAGLLREELGGLDGWIRTRVCGGEPKSLADLDYHELHALINGLRGYARRSGLDVRALESTGATGEHREAAAT